MTMHIGEYYILYSSYIYLKYGSFSQCCYCSNWISPAMLIRLVEELEQREKDENIYEEIIPKARKIGRSKSLFSPLSQGRREHRFTVCEMEQEMNKANKVGRI